MAFLPGWNSLESTARLHDFFEKSGMLMLALLVVAIILAYIYGHRRDYLIDEVLDTAVADRQAAIAERQAAVAERQAAALDRQAALAEAQPPASQKQLTEDDRAAEGAQPQRQLAEAQRDAKNANKKSSEPASPQGPRHLSEIQKTRLLEFLATQPKGKLTIKINPSVPDAQAYGLELGRFLKDKIGWRVRIDEAPSAGADLHGMWLTIRSTDAIPVATGTLRAGLVHAGIPVRAKPEWDPNGPEPNEIWLVIGRRK